MESFETARFFWARVTRQVCPDCGAVEFRRSGRRNLGERVIGVLALPYRCGVCGRRFFRLRWHRDA